MRGKRKFFILILFLFGFKKTEKVNSNFYGEIIARYGRDSFLTTEGFLLRIKDKEIIDSLPRILNLNVKIEPDSFKFNSFLYPSSELLRKIKENNPILFTKIECIEPLSLKVFTRDKKVIQFGLGRFDKKINYLKNLKDFKDTLNLEILSFLEGGK